MYLERPELETWEDKATLERLLERVRSEQPENAERRIRAPEGVESSFLRRIARNPFVQIPLAACVILAAAYAGYCLGTRVTASPALVSNVDAQTQKQPDEQDAAFKEAQNRRISELERQSSAKQQELDRLRSALRALEDRSSDLSVVNSQTEGRLEAISEQRDTLNTQLQTEAQAFERDRAELTKLRAERDQTLLRTASLEARNEELTLTTREQERRLKDAEQYLSSDRDIRELMGARKLYIADVFDVDGSSRTQKPFGRVFYTQGKSLIFYAFDLDRQTKVLNASSFQVWGQREAPEGEQASPMNLGILYMDSEANRRWVMRFDDPQQLAEIDAVFVTVEPHGGSQKPTSKPFLYALLRNEANHP
jgi:anti-sigma-K factor RskA